MPAYREDGGKSYLHKLLSDSSGMYPSTHEVLKLLQMEKCSGMVCCQMKCGSIQFNEESVLSAVIAVPWSRKIRSPNSSSRSPLTRDRSGLDVIELQYGHVFTTC